MIEGVIKDILVAKGVGVYTNPTLSQCAIVLGPLPDRQGDVIGIFMTGGEAPDPRWLLDYPSVTIRLSSDNYGAAMVKVKAIRDALLNTPAQNVTGGRLLGVVSISDFAYVSQSHDKKVEFAGTYRIFFEPQNVVADMRDPL